jgi:tight adherence protein C
MASSIDFLILVVLVVVGAVLFRSRKSEDATSYYARLAREGGLDPDQLRPFYVTSKVLLALLLPLGLMSLQGRFSTPVLLLILSAIGFMLPDLALLIRRNSRRNKILRGLSFYLDLVVSFLRSGLTLEESVNRAAVRGLPATHPLAQEVRLISDEISAGKDRAVAFGALAKRTNLPDLYAVASALELGSRLGFPVAEILATQADLQRDKRADRGKKQIDRAMMLSILPVMLCGFPMFALVVLFPTVTQIYDTFRMVKSLFG